MTPGTTTTSVPRAPGDLVSARGRDWVLQPSPADEADGMVIAQPLDGDREYLTALFPHEIEDPGFGRPRPSPERSATSRRPASCAPRCASRRRTARAPSAASPPSPSSHASTNSSR